MSKDILKKIRKEYRDREESREKTTFYKTDEENIVFDNRDIIEVIPVIDRYTNKEDLANQFIDAIPLYYDKAGLWWKWFNNKKYDLVDETDILNLVKASSNANVIKPSERVEIINALKLVARKRKPKKVKDSWIQFGDEVVDLETGERFQATPEYFFANPIPHRLGKCEDTPTLDKIFEEWVGKAYVKTLYQIIAFCLLTSYPLHRIFCFIGEGSNGKSSFLKLLIKFLGDGNTTSTELETLLKSRFEAAKLYLKLACLMGETNFDEINKSSIIKKLTGEDEIGFEFKHKTPFDGFNYAKIIIATNSLPATRDKTKGFYRRWIIIDFPNEFSEKIDVLKTIPEKEYENLALKCIGILIELLDKREFENEGSVEDRIKRYEDRSDPLQRFLEEFTEEDTDAFVIKSELVKKFHQWCKDNKCRKVSEESIGIKMKSKGIDSGKKYFDWFKDGKGGQGRVWWGIKWKN